MEIHPITNIDEVLSELNAIKARGERMAPLFEEIAGHLYNIADESFENEASPEGAAWQPLAPLTIARKGSDRKLHHSGRLRETLDFDSDDHSASIGTTAVSEKGYPYPAVQQFGTEDGKVPARPFLPFTDSGDLMDSAKDSVLALVQEYFEER